ncbi:MAG: hypothetical protein HZA53_00780 [Planctomycetes bacterium]|nr:hypothetical protein [Planctomycetota bacterium]
MRALPGLLLACAALLARPSPAQCGAWHTEFATLGMDQPVSVLRSLAVGTSSTPALYAGGVFALASEAQASAVARWDGAHWSALGPGLNNLVSALDAFDAGSGPELVAAGAFTAAQGGLTPLNRVARWNGSAWLALGAGMNDQVTALAVFDEGAGPRLFAAGWFTQAGGVPANRIARWDGANWSPLGLGFDLPALALAVFDDGSGPALWAGGEFTTAGGMLAQHVARWNGTSWSAAGVGLDGRVRALAAFDDGSGPMLHAGGNFPSSGAQPMNRVARWNGTSWSPLGAGVDGEVFALAASGPGASGELFAGGAFAAAGGAFASRVARWNGTSWSTASSGATLGMTAGGPRVLALARHDEGAGPRLFAGGDFRRLGGVLVNAVGRWDGNAWSALGTAGQFLGLDGSEYVGAFGELPTPAGPELVVGGRFTVSAGGSVTNVARWTGGAWTPMGSGLAGGEVLAFANYDAGVGPELIAAGRFTQSGGTTLNHVARWDGAQWRPLGSGCDGDVGALAVFDAGAGPELFATGLFEHAGGVLAHDIARWNGTAWSAVPAGPGVIDRLNVGTALTVFDFGAGPALHVGGFFAPSGPTPAGGVARLSGGTWTSLAFPYSVDCLAVYDAGSGAELYSGGTTGLWRFGGAAWTSVLPLVPIYDLRVFDDGSSTAPSLFAAVQYQVNARHGLARWRGNGTPWEDYAGGLDDSAAALLEHDDGDGEGPTLWVGGLFGSAGNVPSHRVARVGGCELTRFCAGDGLELAVSTACPCLNFGAPGHGCASNVNPNGAELAATGRLRPDAVVLLASGMPPTAGAIFLAGDASTPSGIVFGDGVRCVDGALVRLALRVSAGGAAQFPGPGDPSLSVRSGVVSGSGVTRSYQTYYRSTAATFCPPATFNVTNGVRIRW